jgi:hypothetical protein
LQVGAGGSLAGRVANGASFVNMGAVAGQLVNDGLAANGGTIAGLVTNSGTGTNHGLLAGGLINNGGAAFTQQRHHRHRGDQPWRAGHQRHAQRRPRQ